MKIIKALYNRSLSATLTGSLILFAVYTGASEAPKSYETVVLIKEVIECRSGNCARTDAARWSDLPENTRNIAISIRMGTKPAVTLDELIEFLAKGFSIHDIETVKFFHEQNDAPAIGIAIHLRGGTDGVYTLANVEEIKKAVKRNSRLAKIDLFR